MDELGQLLRELVRSLLLESANDIKGVAPRPVLAPNRSEQSKSIANGVVTEKMISRFVGEDVSFLELSGSVVVTPLAREAARREGIELKQNDRRS